MISSTIRKAFGFVLAAVAVTGAAPPAGAADSAVIIMYHRFGETAYPSTNITLDQFESHIRELKSGPYAVLPLPEIVARLRDGRPLPERTVGLSVDDAYLSAYTEAWPRLKAAGLPMTLFVATRAVDRKLSGIMTWQQIRELAADGVSIGSQTETHLHMPDAGEARNRQEIERSNGRFITELGRAPRLFAYPYGEAGTAVQRIVRDAGFAAAFGQHSGVIGRAANYFYLPRFSMNEKYGDLSRFRLAANALPLPVSDVTPSDPLITGVNPPPIGFTVGAGIKGLGRMTCFASHEGGARLERLGERRFEVRVNTPFPRGRTRLNCTVPAKDGRWRWLGRQFYVPG
jgi:peptidoglycan/xylan/chitin deacetylase (PgdA/CDA1 family)